MTTNVPPLQFTPTGIVVPSQSAILAGVQADLNAAFGGNLNLALNTPQGQLASSWAAAIFDCYSQFAYLANQMDPDNNTGFMQDAIGRIYFLNRKPGEPTVVACTCVGLFGTVIPVGAQAQDTSGNLYVCTQAATIPVGGSVVVQFANMVNGPIACPSNTLTQIYRSIPGWDTINNVSAGVEGANVESPAAFEYRRQQSVAINAHGSLPSIYANVFAVEDVIDVYGSENVTDDTINVGSTDFPLLPHSVYIGVAGGDAQAIAQAIWQYKDLGCNMNGDTTEVVTDQSGYEPPFPTYNITFQRLIDTPIYFSVLLAASSSLPVNIDALVQAAIIAQFTGANGGNRARAGALLLASPYYGAVQTIGPEVSILSILIGSAFAGTATLINGDKTITIDTLASGTVSLGTVLSGTGIPTGSQIVKQLTGMAGQTGTYYMTIPASASVGPTAIAGTPGTGQLIGIEQEPTIEAGNITVSTE